MKRTRPVPWAVWIWWIPIVLALCGLLPNLSAGQGLEAVKKKVRTQFPRVRQLSTAELAAWLGQTNRPQPMLLDTRSSVAMLVLLLAWESATPFFAYFVRAAGERTRHALKNMALGVLNAVVTGLLFVGLWLGTAAWAERQHFGLLHWVELPAWARLAGALLVFDAWMYWWHRLNHRVPFLWRFHRTHHSDPRMDVTTANRFHLGEIVLSSILRVPVVALLGLRLWELALYEAAMFTVVQLHHANIALPAWLDRGLRGLLVTPFMHKVHHSRWQPETDSNYSSLFSFWDRLLRSYRLRDGPRTLRFGLDEFDRPEDHTLTGLLATPLKPVQRAAGEPPANAASNL